MKTKRLWLDYTTLRSALDYGAILDYYHIDYIHGRNHVSLDWHRCSCATRFHSLHAWF